MRKNFFIDFDGVILDTQYFITKHKKDFPNLSWSEYLKIINWHELINEAKEINDSISILKSLNNKNNIFILTKIHTLDEGKEKVLFLRSNGINIPVFITPPEVGKETIILPKKTDILVDDFIENINSWIRYGGYGILFDNYDLHQNEKNIERQKSLKFLNKN